MRFRNAGIVIVNWNNREDILNCLARLGQLGELKRHMVVVVDNGSTDRSVEDIQKHFPTVVVIECRENLGYAAGNNRGIQYVMNKGVDYVFILNPDTFVHSDCIQRLLDSFETSEKVGIVGPLIYGKDGTIWGAGGEIDQKRYSGGLTGLGEKKETKYHQRSVDYVPGTALMIRAEALDRCGLFCDDYFIYYEDVELSCRARKAGYTCLLVPHAVIEHHESTSFGAMSPTHSYYMARNHLLFVQRNAPWEIQLREYVRLPKTILEHWYKGEFAALMGIKDFLFRRFGKRKIG